MNLQWAQWEQERTLQEQRGRKEEEEEQQQQLPMPVTKKAVSGYTNFSEASSREEEVAFDGYRFLAGNDGGDGGGADSTAAAASSSGNLLVEWATSIMRVSSTTTSVSAPSEPTEPAHVFQKPASFTTPLKAADKTPPDLALVPRLPPPLPSRLPAQEARATTTRSTPSAAASLSSAASSPSSSSSSSSMPPLPRLIPTEIAVRVGVHPGREASPPGGKGEVTLVTHSTAVSDPRAVVPYAPVWKEISRGTGGRYRPTRHFTWDDPRGMSPGPGEERRWADPRQGKTLVSAPRPMRLIPLDLVHLDTYSEDNPNLCPEEEKRRFLEETS